MQASDHLSSKQSGLSNLSLNAPLSVYRLLFLTIYDRGFRKVEMMCSLCVSSVLHHGTS